MFYENPKKIDKGRKKNANPQKQKIIITKTKKKNNIY
jgi:hypothetical protein